MLFIDARKLGSMISRVQCEFTDELIAHIANTVALWRGDDGSTSSPRTETETVRTQSNSSVRTQSNSSVRTQSNSSVRTQSNSSVRTEPVEVSVYQDIPGFCRSVTLAEIAQHGHVLTPGRYVGAEAVEDDDEGFADKMQKLTEQLGEQMAKGAELDGLIRAKFGGMGYEF